MLTTCLCVMQQQVMLPYILLKINHILTYKKNVNKVFKIFDDIILGMIHWLLEIYFFTYWNSELFTIKVYFSSWSNNKYLWEKDLSQRSTLEFFIHSLWNELGNIVIILKQIKKFGSKNITFFKLLLQNSLLKNKSVFIWNMTCIMYLFFILLFLMSDITFPAIALEPPS